ncbi:MAG TPA: glycine cleavage system aminomethyltransferase GcvT [Thermomicrobiales bacterium]|nr:glycine cleavage system aminomethyltransferase GcvT [Thermomicrobiales bacterium]
MQRTPLAEKHEALGAKMVDFAGWYMPVQYSGIMDEHRAVRTAAGLFDLGHMGQVDVSGPDALAYLQYVASNDVSLLGPSEAQYALLCYPDGGVIDDIIIYRRPSGVGFFVVINAGNKDKDVAWLHEQREARSDLDVEVKHISDETGMIAIQGPNAVEIVSGLSSVDLNDMKGFSCRETEIAGIPCLAGRTGYTGEDGWEFYCPIEQVGELWDALLEAGKPHGLQPIGLGARDTLRLEARMPLYGNELSTEINPLEAGLGWAVKLNKGDFIGRDALAAAKEAGINRRSVGFKMVERGGVPRSHYDVAVDGNTIGFVTSGTSSPSLGENIGLAIIDKAYAGAGKPLDIIVRGKPVRAEQIKTPFYKRES